jgi:hypothetical protein
MGGNLSLLRSASCASLRAFGNGKLEEAGTKKLEGASR